MAQFNLQSSFPSQSQDNPRCYFQFNLRCQSQFRPLYHRLDPIYPILGFRPYSRILDGGQDPPLGPARSVSPLSHGLFAHWASKEGSENCLHKKTKKMGPFWRLRRPQKSIVANLAPKMTPKWRPMGPKGRQKGTLHKNMNNSFFAAIYYT